MQVLLWVVALFFLSAAVALGVIAWRMARGARERESARVELLKTMAFPEASAVPASDPSISNSNWTAGFISEHETAPAMDAYEPAPSIFAEREKPLKVLPRWIPLAAVGAAMFVGVRLYVMIASGPATPSVTTPAARAAATPTTANTPTTEVSESQVELIALRYQFGRAEAFDVSGVVRNPADGRVLPQLTAVVDLLDADGRIVASQRTRLEEPGLEAGETSAFSVAFPRVTGTVANYQVGFRLPSGDTIMQVDRRAPELAAKTR